MSKKKGVVYLAGPMRGILEYNFPAFRRQAWLLRELGFEVISPHEMDEENGFDPFLDKADDQFLRQAMNRDLSAICERCTAIALLPGWEKSKGVQVELALARFLDLEVLNALTGLPLLEEEE